MTQKISFSKALSKYRGLVRGAMSYAVIWPVCSIAQEYIEHGKPLAKADWNRAARYSFFGTFCMAPMVYFWQNFSNRFFKKKSLGAAITRALFEQVTFTPIGLATFFIGMTLLEGKDMEAAKNEIELKLLPTYKRAIVFWPTVQTVNFYLIPETNRVVYVSVASFLWIMYLAHMKAEQGSEFYQLESNKNTKKSTKE